MRLLAGAEDYGLGPCAKLLAVAGALRERGVELDFVGRGIALDLARRSGHFGRLHAPEALSELPGPKPAGVLAVMEPQVAAWGYSHGLPVFTVDSLYPTWRWTGAQQAEVLGKLPAFRASGRPAALFAQLAAWPRHLRFFAAHAMAQRCLIQRWDRVRRGDPGEAQLPLQPVPAIVDLSRRQAAPRAGLLLSLAGMVNLHGSARRRTGYRRLVEALLEGLWQGPAVWTAPEGLRTDLPVQLRSFAHAEMLAGLNEAAVVLAPPGLTTLLECAAYGAPLLLLPEQHRGHVRNMAGLARLLGGQPQRARLYPGALLEPRSVRTRGWFGRSLELEAVQRGLLRGRWPGVRAELRATLEASLKVVVSGGGTALAAAQRAALQEAIGGFEGAAICAQAVIAGLQEAG